MLVLYSLKQRRLRGDNIKIKINMSGINTATVFFPGLGSLNLEGIGFEK